MTVPGGYDLGVSTMLEIRWRSKSGNSLSMEGHAKRPQAHAPKPDDQHGISVHIRSATARLVVVGTLGTGFLIWLLGQWLK
jgi:hypothetical protein